MKKKNVGPLLGYMKREILELNVHVHKHMYAFAIARQIMIPSYTRTCSARRSDPLHLELKKSHILKIKGK